MTILNLHAHQGKDGAFQKIMHKMEMKIAQMVLMNTVRYTKCLLFPFKVIRKEDLKNVDGL